MTRSIRLSLTAHVSGFIVTLFGVTLAAGVDAQTVAPAAPEFLEISEEERISPPGAELESLQNSFRTSLTDDPQRAQELAKEIVALAAATFGEDHKNLSRALTNLAIVQFNNKEYATSIENYRSAIVARERADGTLVDPELINPLRGLAASFMALNEIDAAIPIYERAIHITHVNEGPSNLDQVPVIDALSRAYFFQGDLDTASDLQDTIFRLKQRRFDEESDGYIDALAQRARWYVALGNSAEAVQVYRRLERSISKKYGDDSPRLIAPLVSLANAAVRIEDFGEPAVNEGRRAMARAVRIARERAEEDTERFARTLVEQGDWLATLDRTRNSRLPYREAWKTLNSNAELHPVRDELFANPVPILSARFRTVHGLRNGASASASRFPNRGYTDIAFDVDPLGRPVNVRIIAGDPPGIMDTHLRRQIRRFRFRPAFRAGQPVSFTGLAYRHSFRYNESDLTERDRETIAAATSASPSNAEGVDDANPIRRNVNLDPRRRNEPFIGEGVSGPVSPAATDATPAPEVENAAAQDPANDEAAAESDTETPPPAADDNDSEASATEQGDAVETTDAADGS
ncbi:MAG: tetratricopeptide repeat protein [Pseudomonadota bacterium]